MYKEIMDSLIDHVASIDLNGKITFTNQAWKNFSIVNEGDLVQTDIGVNYLEVLKNSKSLKLRSIKRRCGPTPFSTRRTSTWDSLTHRCPAACRMRSRSIERRSRSTRRWCGTSPVVGGPFQPGTGLRANARPRGRRHCGIPDGPADEARFRVGALPPGKHFPQDGPSAGRDRGVSGIAEHRPRRRGSPL